MSEARNVTDLDTLKAVAHPLRVRLLGALRSDGPSTASALGRRFGESSGSTSYHLRQLERFGFVEEDDRQPSGRERRWRATHRHTSLDEADFAHDPEGRDAISRLRAVQRAALTRHAEAFDQAAESTDWLSAAGQSDYAARLSAASTRALISRFSALIREYELRDTDDPEAREMFILAAAFPRTAER